MSSIQNVITTTFRARGNQAIAQMGTITQGFGSIGRAINENTRASERLNAQWKAIGTTIRYSIAGSAVFGLTKMVQQLKDVQVQMGLISAIGETAGGKPLVGQQLANVMDAARAGAVESITPVKDFNDAMINLYSTLKGVPGDEVVKIVTDISKTAQLAQISAEDATKAFTTMNVAFGIKPNRANIFRMQQEFASMIKEAPGGKVAGQQIIGQLGQLATITRAGHGTPQDMFSTILSVLRGGMPPAQAGRGLTYFLQTLAFPANAGSDESKKALASVGITPTSTMPLQERMTRIFRRARSLGIRGNLGKVKDLPEETLSDLEARDDPSANISAQGLSGPGAVFLGQAFHRIHALRTALSLLTQIDTGQAQKDIKIMADGWAGHAAAVDDLRKQWQRFEKQATLQKAAVAVDALRLQVAQAFSPVLNFAARGITGTQKLAQRHPDITKDVIYGGAAFLGAMGLGRLAGSVFPKAVGRFTSRLPGPLGRLGNLLTGGVGKAFLAETAATAAMHPGGAIGSSPQNPLYVIVVGQIFGQPLFGQGKVGDPLTGLKGEAAKDAEKAAEKGAAKAGEKSLAKTILKDAEKVAAGGGFLSVLKAIRGRAGGLAGKAGGLFEGLGPRVLAGGEIAAKLGGKKLIPGASIFDFFANPDELTGGKAEEQWVRHLKTLRKANPQYGGAAGTITGYEDVKKGTFKGRAEVFMTIDVTQPDGRVVRKHVHVPVDMWKNGSYPSNKGQAAKTGRSN